MTATFGCIPVRVGGIKEETSLVAICVVTTCFPEVPAVVIGDVGLTLLLDTGWKCLVFWSRESRS